MKKEEIYQKLGELSIREKQVQAQAQQIVQEQNKLYAELEKALKKDEKKT